MTIKLTPDTAEVSAHAPYSSARRGDLCVLPINIQLSKIIRLQKPEVSLRSIIPTAPTAHLRLLLLFPLFLPACRRGRAATPQGPRCALVGLGRLELPTSPLSGVRSNHLSYRPVAIDITGGAGRDRTGDLLNANQALSQLSYSPLNPTEARSRKPHDSTGSRIRSYFPRPIGRGTGVPDPNPEEP